MKVAHLAIVTPGRCGLYETTRELVAGLRARGVDSCIVDPTQAENKLYPDALSDRGARLAEMSWALDADVLVSHSGLGPELEATKQPLIHVAHGRPRSTFLMERAGKKVYSHMYNKNKQDRCKAVVGFWPEHEAYLEVIFPNTPVHTVQAPVDLGAWNDGPSTYDFGGKGGEINVVCTDVWRRDIDPFVPINAFALWARELPNVKLHLYGVTDTKGLRPLITTLRDDGTLGVFTGWTDDLANVYRAAHCSLTPQYIDTRSVREAMACGCPVVRIPGPHLNGFRPLFWEALGRSRAAVRQEAEKRFDPAVTAEQFHNVLLTVSGG